MLSSYVWLGVNKYTAWGCVARSDRQGYFQSLKKWIERQCGSTFLYLNVWNIGSASSAIILRPKICYGSRQITFVIMAITTPIIFNTRDELIKVDIDKMIYAMAEDNYVHLFFRNGQSVMVTTTLQSLEQLILSVIAKNKKGVYTRIGRKYIVNNSYIMQINTLKQQLVLSDMDVIKPITLNVSKEALKVLKSTITENKK